MEGCYCRLRISILERNFSILVGVLHLFVIVVNCFYRKAYKVVILSL